MSKWTTRYSVMLLAVLAVLLRWTDVLAQTLPDLLPAPPATVCTSTTVPTEHGSVAMWPGRWWNPRRAGIGWDFFYGEGEQSMYLTWFAFDQNGRPIWLHGENKTVQLNSVTGDRTWQSRLYKITWNPSGNKIATAVGAVSVTFPRDTTTRSAVRWKWSDVDGAVHDECLLDQRDSFLARGQTESTPLNQAYSSNYFYDAETTHPLNGWGVDLLIDIEHASGTNYKETATVGIFDAGNQPVWLQSVDNWGSVPPASSTFPVPPSTTLDHGALRYLRHAPSATHPLITDCTNDACVYVAYDDHTGTDNRFLRDLPNGRRGTMSVKANVPASVTNAPPSSTAAAAVLWPPPTNQTPFPDRLPVFRFDGNHIIVDRSVCRVASATEKCSFIVSWVTDDPNAVITRIDLRRNGYRTVLTKPADKNEIIESLGVDDRMQYEIAYNAGTLGGSGNLRTPEVRVLLQGAMADEVVQPVDCTDINNGCDLGAHDPTVGAVAGEASTDGGAAAYTIPIAIPPGRNGMQPSLALSYSSRSGNGIAGVGWGLSGLSSIHRCPQTAAQDGKNVSVRYGDTDRLCLDGQRLVTLSGASYGASGATYRTEIDSFSRITQIGSLGGPSCFKVELKSGRILHYGGIVSSTNSCTSNASSVVAGGMVNQPLSWMLAKVEDRVGNNQFYTYNPGAYGETLLTSVDYTGFGATAGTRHVRFEYETRPGVSSGADTGSSYLSGGLTMQTQRLKSISTSYDGNPNPVRVYKLDYTNTAGSYSLHSGRSLLTKVEECAYTGSTQICKAPTLFKWNDLPVDHVFRKVPNLDSVLSATIQPDPDGVDTLPRDVQVIGDLDGDGVRETLVTQRESGGAKRSYIVKYKSDRTADSAVEVPFPAMVAEQFMTDIDSDGRTDYVELPVTVGKLHLRVSNLPRGNSFPANGAGLLQDVVTSIDWNPAFGADLYVGAYDANADGNTDIVAFKPVGTCGAGSGAGSICIYPGARAVDGSYTFSSAVPGAIVPANHRPEETKVDVNGDGIADILVDLVVPTTVQRLVPDKVLVSTPTGDTNLPTCAAQGTALYALCDLSDIKINKTPLQDLANANQWFWRDINGDGLVDFVFASIQEKKWYVQLNTGRGFGDAIAVQGGTEALTRDRDHRRFRYLGKTPWVDVDGDGGDEVLFPVKTAARICVRATYPYDPAHEGQCPAAMRPTGTDSVAAINTCVVMVCPEDPSVAEDPPPPYKGTPIEQWRAQHFKLPSTLNSYPVVGTYANGYMGVSFDFSHTDSSAYEMAALRFVQTGPTSFRAEQVSLDASGGDAYRKTHKVIASLNTSGHDAAMDLYGDGLTDIVTQVGCHWSPLRQQPSGIDNHCEALFDSAGYYGPQFLPDGTDVTTLAGTASPYDSGLRLYVNENIGAYERSGTAPAFPELLSSVNDGLRRSTTWDYYPLSSNAGRLPTQLPLYGVISGTDPLAYIDSRHFYFTSSMPVVSVMSQNSGVGINGFRTWRYGYSEAMYNHVGRGFQGFRGITQEQITYVGDQNRVMRTATTFHQKFPLTGKVEKVVSGVPNGAAGINPVREESTTWGCNVLLRNQACDTANALAPTNYPFVNEQTVKNYDLVQAESGGSTLVSTTTVRNYDSTKANESGWDPYGNAKDQETESADNYVDAGGQGNFVAKRLTKVRNNYTVNTGSWWLDRLDNTLTTIAAVTYAPSHPLPSGIALPPEQTLKTDNSYDLVTRLITKVEVQKDLLPGSERNQQYSSTTFVYPSSPNTNFGLPSDIIKSGVGLGLDANAMASRTTHIVYDSSTAPYFPFETTTEGLRTVALYRPEDGQLESTLTPNGVYTATVRDAFGRATKTYQNAGGVQLGQPTWSAWQPCAVGACVGVGEGGFNSQSLGAERYAAYRVTTVQNGSPTQVVWYDVLDREIKKATRGFDGTFVATLTDYDAMGTVSRTSVPFFLNDANSRPLYSTSLTYDRLGRVKTKNAPGAEIDPVHGNVNTTYTYAGNRTDISVTPSLGGCVGGAANLCMNMRRYQGVLGMMRTEDAKGGITRYWYDAAGRPVAIANANNPGSGVTQDAVTRATYNPLGHRLTLNDPDQGSWTFTYNPLGELHLQIDARHWSTSIDRDTLGRPRVEVATEYRTDGAQSTQFRNEWDYEASTGLLRESRSCTLLTGTCGQTPPWKETYAYDAAGRPTSTQVLNNQWQDTTTYLYDANFGREKGIVYPSGLRVQTRYTKWGEMQDLLDADTGERFWGMGAKDAWGNPTLERYGNGLIGEYTSSASTGQSLTRQWRGGESDQTPIDDRIAYGYDSLGNLKAQTRLPGSTSISATESYTYDPLQRLTRSTSLAKTVDYTYDALGNFTSKSDFGTSYNYSPGPNKPNGCGPNVADSVNTPSGSVSFTCDKNGNLLSSTSASNGYPSRTIAYDPKNRPLQVTAVQYNSPASGAIFQYASDGRRVFEQLNETVANSTAARTRYLRRGVRGFEGESDSLPVTGSVRTMRHELGDATVVMKSTDNTGGNAGSGLIYEVYYRHADRLGSPLGISNRSRAFLEVGDGPSVDTRRSFDAFGMVGNYDFSRRQGGGVLPDSLSLTPATRNGFTGHEHLDALGLIHMNGRAYDYRLGRFLSVDPFIQFPANSQSLNPYSYVLNNPFAGLDPTGYACEAMTGSHICGHDTGAENGQSKETKTVTDKQSGQRVTYTKTVSASGTTVMVQVASSMPNGASRGSSSSGNARTEKNTDIESKTPGQIGLQQAAEFGKGFAEVGEQVLEVAAPVDPDHPLVSVGVPFVGKAAAKGLARARGGLFRKIEEEALAHVDVERKIAKGMLRGGEIELKFSSLNSARNSARELSKLGDDAVDFVQELGPFKGRVTGRMSPDGSRGWRIDFDDAKGFHVNWWRDRYEGTKRDSWLYGANKIVGGTQDDYWQALQHFPEP